MSVLLFPDNTVVSTWDLLRVAHKHGWVDTDTLWATSKRFVRPNEARRPECGTVPRSRSGWAPDAPLTEK